MSPEEQLAWPKPRIRDPEGRERVGGVEPSKKRSPVALEAETWAGAAGSQAEEQRQGRRRSATIVKHYVAEQAAWTTRLARTDAEFQALGDAWSALLSESVDANVFMSHEWLYAWWTAYRPDARLAIVLVLERDHVRGIAPLMIETVTRAGVSARVLRFIGDGTGETDHVNLLTPRRDRARVLHALLDAIDTLDWDVAEFNQIPEASENTQDLLDWMNRTGLRSVVTSSPCPVRRLPSTYDALVASLPSRLRTSIRSSLRKLRERHRIEFGLHEDVSELDTALQAFFANHESRWQEGKGKAGAFSNASRRSFYERISPRLLERGWLRFFYLMVDGRVVAQQYCFSIDGTVMLLQEGFDFSHANDNVGNVLRALVFEHLIKSGALCYDFLAGSSRHKQSWGDGTVNDLRIRCARRSWRGWLYFALPLLIERAKDALRPWRDRLYARVRRAAPDPEVN